MRHIATEQRKHVLTVMNYFTFPEKKTCHTAVTKLATMLHVTRRQELTSENKQLLNYLV